MLQVRRKARGLQFGGRLRRQEGPGQLELQHERLLHQHIRPQAGRAGFRHPVDQLRSNCRRRQRCRRRLLRDTVAEPQPERDRVGCR